jgi:hypothetical protein
MYIIGRRRAAPRRGRQELLPVRSTDRGSVIGRVGEARPALGMERSRLVSLVGRAPFTYTLNPPVRLLISRSDLPPFQVPYPCHLIPGLATLIPLLDHCRKYTSTSRPRDSLGDTV